jgi:hypothetical protein
MSKVIERTLGIVAIILILLSLSGCATITEGVIIEKEFIPAHTESILIPVVTKVGNSTITNLIPVVRDYEDQWVIIFEGINEEGEKETRKVYTNEATYNSCKIGENFVYITNRDSDEPEYTEVEL